MSLRYKGARLSATPPTTVGGTTAGANAAPGIWTLDQQMKAQGQSAWPGAGNWIEDVFSTYLYAGNSSTQTITNDINLSGQGGLVWIKDRTNIADHRLIDTVTGAQKELISNQTTAQVARTTGLTAFNNNGFSLGSASGYNTTATNYVSWAFREQSKFFDVVTYTGNGIARTIPHNLGSVPGCIIVKVTSAAGNWWVYHRSLTNAQYLVLNTTAAVASGSLWNSTTPTATEFSIGATSDINNSGATYVAYLFAHNAGGFGASGTDNVISCGSWTGTGVSPGPTITLGYEPQWVMWKRTDAGTEQWHIRDNMRGMPLNASGRDLYANSSSAEGATTNEGPIPTATGFQIIGTNTNANANGGTYIYVAIRRGPMKTPTLGTTVFGLNARSGTSSNATVTGGQIADHFFVKNRGLAVADLWTSRLLGADYGETNTTAAITPSGATQLQSNPWDVMDGVKVGTTGNQTNSNSYTYINYMFRRAPGFFDVVGYTGTTSARTVNHNLGSVPEIIIVKERSGASTWAVYTSAGGNTNSLFLDSANSYSTSVTYWNSTTPTSSVFSLGTGSPVNANGGTYIAYLFATLAGVSKVGSYTGTGTTQQVNCGFTSGARFILIKRTDSTGDWYYWDTARGIVAGNDPYLLLNSTAVEVTNTDYVDTFSSGFELSSTAPAAINANGGTYIFLAIA